MALPIESDAFRDLVVVLASAGLVIPAFSALRLPPAVGFILVGVAAGPFGLGALGSPFDELALSDAANLAPAAELGVAMLLFALGLELTLDRLRVMRRLVFGPGAAQLALCSLALALLGLAAGVGLGASLALGFALALSSTAVGLQLLSASGRINSQSGRTAFGILLFQDIAIAPALLLLAAGAAGVAGFGLAVGRGLLAIAAIVLAGRLLLRPLFTQAARTRSPELFLAAALVVAIGAAAATAAAGLSPVIGALVAGIVLAESEYRRSIEAAIAPFQGLLLGVFLIWVGMRLDFGAVADRPLLLGVALAAVIALKAGLVFGLLRGFGRSAGHAAHVALLLAPTSETGLVVLGAAATAGVVAPALAAPALVGMSLGLALAPLFGLLGARLEGRERHVAAQPLPAPEPGRTVIIGFGRVGRTVAGMLERHQRPYLAVDGDPDLVARQRAAGRPVAHGDARRPELLAGLGLDTAPAVVLTLDDPAVLETLVRAIRERWPQLVVVARARDADDAARLYRLGVTDAVPETIEASLQLAEAVLVDLGVPMGPVIASVHEKRAELRAAMTAGATQPLPERRTGRRRLRDAGDRLQSFEPPAI